MFQKLAEVFKMNNSESKETAKVKNDGENPDILFEADGIEDDQYLTELLHKFKKFVWQLFYPLWKTKGFR